MTDFSDLSNIFRMMAPSDLFGVPKTTLGSTDVNLAAEVIRRLFDQQGGGAITAPEMKKTLAEQLLLTPQELRTQFHQTIRFYSSEGNTIDPSVDWYAQVPSRDQTKLEPLGDFRTLIGASSPLSERGKRMAIVMSTSNFITPAVRKASTSELFLNFMPSYVMSRCVPYLDAEFVFDRQVTAGNKLAAPSLLKFLLGSQDTTGDAAKNFPAGSANALMAGAQIIENNTESAASGEQHTVVGMEMFTSPQTLVDPSLPPVGSRYVSVLDLFRPFATIEGLTVNVTPTVGTFSYKKATLTMKLHDRSRLADIADLIKPLVYTKTTVWLTYGWRHPIEGTNPYASFINDHMLVREPYGIVNASYTFDQVGQVTLTLELFTKGVRELRDIKITGLSESFEDIQRQISTLAEDIATYRQRLNLDKPTGLNKEIRSSQILESGERGEFPDLKPSEVQTTISNLQKSLVSSGGKIDQDAATKLIDSLNQLYAVKGTNSQSTFNFKEKIENQVSATVNALFKELQSGPDPFLMTAARDVERIKQLNLPAGSFHPFVKLAESYNKIRQADKAPTDKTKSGTPGPAPYLKRLVSFGKIFSVFVGRGVVSIAGLDELQIFFYNFNERAGLAANMNIAEFPIDLAVFFEQFKDHVNRQRSDHITLEEFMKLVIQAQLGDVRGVGYGFFSHFEPYDPKNSEPQLKKNQEQNFENAYNGQVDKLGPFKMPAIDVYVESTYATTSGKKTDLLTTFTQAARQDAQRKGDNYVKVMRIHVYDRQIDPYPMATSLLKRDDAGSASTMLARQELLSSQYKDAITKGFSGLPQDIQEALRQDPNHGVVINDLVSNEKIKHFVSKLIPTITYGGNASTVISANVASKQDPLLTSVQMMANKAGRPSVTQPNGGGTGGLPLRIIPASVTINSLGCPLLDYMQLFFLDWATGTTLDNVYGVTGLTHTINPGKFESSMTMTFYDAYGRFESPATFLKEIAQIEVPK
jgi:hypothetical protein